MSHRLQAFTRRNDGPVNRNITCVGRIGYDGFMYKPVVQLCSLRPRFHKMQYYQTNLACQVPYCISYIHCSLLQATWGRQFSNFIHELGGDDNNIDDDTRLGRQEAT